MTQTLYPHINNKNKKKIVTNAKRWGGEAQVRELPSNREALSSNPSTAKINK
jgi:hypothetical protein